MKSENLGNVSTLDAVMSRFQSLLASVDPQRAHLPNFSEIRLSVAHHRFFCQVCFSFPICCFVWKAEGLGGSSRPNFKLSGLTGKMSESERRTIVRAPARRRLSICCFVSK